jgi:hypothetical protein
LRPTRFHAKSFGYVATGPGFYVWEEHLRDAQRAARDLSAPTAAPRSAVRVRPSVRRRRRPS